MKLRYNENNIMFQLRAPVYDDRENLIYRYRLEGFNENSGKDEWIDAGSKNYAAYTNLPYGEYQFQYQAASGYGSWPEDYRTFDLIITPSFYQTLLFKVIIILVATALIAVVIYYVKRLYSEVKEREQAQTQLLEELREKDVLIREVHHRVKNNLAIIISLLNLQEGTISSVDEGIEAFSKTRKRIYSMALIHEFLYLNDKVSSIEMKSYIQEIVSHMIQGSGRSGRFNMTIDIGSMLLGLSKAIPCGLILNEILDNSLKHAYPDDEGGEIYIGFKRTLKSDFVMTVRDYGIGLSEEELDGSRNTLGLTIVQSLASQLGGEVAFNSIEGTEFRLEFPDTEL